MAHYSTGLIVYSKQNLRDPRMVRASEVAKFINQYVHFPTYNVIELGNTDLELPIQKSCLLPQMTWYCPTYNVIELGNTDLESPIQKSCLLPQMTWYCRNFGQILCSLNIAIWLNYMSSVSPKYCSWLHHIKLLEMMPKDDSKKEWLRWSPGVLSEKLGAGVYSQKNWVGMCSLLYKNPYPIYTLILRFSLPFLCSDLKFDSNC